MQSIDKDQYIEFGIEQELYAISIHDIYEIIKIQDITPIPNMRSFVKGVINLRGNIVPVISMRELFGMEEIHYTRTSRIIVVHHEEEAVGIIVDYVNKVTTFSDIQMPPDRVGSVMGSFFTGIGVSDNGLAAILRLDQVLLHD